MDSTSSTNPSGPSNEHVFIAIQFVPIADVDITSDITAMSTVAINRHIRTISQHMMPRVLRDLVAGIEAVGAEADAVFRENIRKIEDLDRRCLALIEEYLRRVPGER